VSWWSRGHSRNLGGRILRVQVIQKVVRCVPSLPDHTTTVCRAAVEPLRWLVGRRADPASTLRKDAVCAYSILTGAQTNDVSCRLTSSGRNLYPRLRARQESWLRPRPLELTSSGTRTPTRQSVSRAVSSTCTASRFPVPCARCGSPARSCAASTRGACGGGSS
jgi:hypothetical protein